MLEPTYLDFEKNFDPGRFVYLAAGNYWLAYVSSRRVVCCWMRLQATFRLSQAICAVYLVAIFAGQRIMKSWPAFKLDKQLKYWNLALSIFSTIGMLRTFPQLLVNLSKHGLDETVSDDIGSS